MYDCTAPSAPPPHPEMMREMKIQSSEGAVACSRYPASVRNCAIKMIVLRPRRSLSLPHTGAAIIEHNAGTLSSAPTITSDAWYCRTIAGSNGIISV